jgi:hypothetical protein
MKPGRPQKERLENEDVAYIRDVIETQYSGNLSEFYRDIFKEVADQKKGEYVGFPKPTTERTVASAFKNAFKRPIENARPLPEIYWRAMQEIVGVSRGDLPSRSPITKGLPPNPQSTVDPVDQNILELVERLFGRSAYKTSINDEEGQKFRKAISDTIKGLNTGIWQTREDQVIDTFHSRFDAKDLKLKSALEDVAHQLGVLRSQFDHLVVDHQITREKDDHAGFERWCWHYTPRAQHLLQELRSNILTQVEQICPSFRRRMEEDPTF